jgi:hypothetical protein
MARARGLVQSEEGMERCSLAFASFVLLAAIGCAAPGSAGPRANVPAVVVVALVDGPPISVGGAPMAPHPDDERDGFAVGDRVQIEWQGSWLPATLIERRGDHWLVRYDAGPDSREDGEEAVARARIRVAVEAADDETGEGDVDP